MKKILIISSLKDRGSGSEVVLEELLRGWTSKTITPVLLTPAESQIHRVAIELGVEWCDLPVKKDGMHLRDNLWAVKEAVSDGLPHCVAAIAWTIRGFPAAQWIGQHWDIPVAGVLHDNPLPAKVRGSVLWDMRGMDWRTSGVWKQMLWSSREYILHTWWRWNWAHRAANQFSRLICVSEAVQRECEKKGYQCPLSVIRNGLADLPVQGRAPDAKLRIGFLGAGQPQRKGFSIVEQWIRQLQGNVIWKLYGGASEKTLALIGRLQEVAPVEYRGFQKRDAIFSEIDVLVHASNLFDPLPTVLIEAARAGLPCIASSNGGAAEIVEAGGSGFIFDPKDPADGLEKLRRLLDPQLRAAMGQAAREIFDKKFRVERMVREYEEFFEQLAAGKK